MKATNKVIMFEFEEKKAQKQIFDMSLCSVQGHCQSMKKRAPSVGLTKVEFRMVQFWVQIHDLGLEKFNA